MIYRSWGTSHSKDHDAVLLYEAEGWKALVLTALDLVPSHFCCGRFTPSFVRDKYHDWIWKFGDRHATVYHLESEEELKAFLSAQAWWRDNE